MSLFLLTSGGSREFVGTVWRDTRYPVRIRQRPQIEIGVVHELFGSTIGVSVSDVRCHLERVGITLHHHPLPGSDWQGVVLLVDEGNGCPISLANRYQIHPSFPLHVQNICTNLYFCRILGNGVTIVPPFLTFHERLSMLDTSRP